MKKGTGLHLLYPWHRIGLQSVVSEDLPLLLTIERDLEKELTNTSLVRFTSFPRTKPPPSFIQEIIAVFRKHEAGISTTALAKGLKSDPVLRLLAPDLASLGFVIEVAKNQGKRIERPVFYGENGEPILRYEIDAYHPGWHCGLELEAGRAILGNAVFRDLFQAMVMTDVDHLCMGVPNTYKFRSGGRAHTSRNYDKAITIADALYGHTRVNMPYGLTVIGY